MGIQCLMACHGDGLDAEIFRKLQENCESSNNAIFSLVESTCGMNELVQAP